jgi:hypothetical protein
MHVDSCESCQMVGCKDHGFYSHYPEECNHFSRKKGCSSHSNNMNNERFFRTGDLIFTLSDGESKHLLSVMQLDSLKGDRKSIDLFSKLWGQYVEQYEKRRMV